MNSRPNYSLPTSPRSDSFMPNRVSWVVVAGSVAVLLVHLVFDLQVILSNRYAFLDEVRVTIHYERPDAHTRLSVWRTTLDNKELELNDKLIDPASRTVVYQNVPRSTFIRTLYLNTNGPANPGIHSVSVTIGPRTSTYSWAELQRTWRAKTTATGHIVWTFPATGMLPASVLPTIRDIINWRGDGLLVRYIILHNLTLLLFIGLYLLLSIWRAGLTYLFGPTAPATRLIGLALGMALLKSTFQVWPLDANLDPSFVAGLSWARAGGLRWGTDLIFTYGPYFWLINSSIIMPAGTLWLAFLGNWLLTALALGVMLVYLRHLYTSNFIGYPTLLIGLLLLLVFHYDFLDYLVVAVLLLVYRYGINPSPASHRWPSRLLLQTAVALLALLSLIKFSYVAFSASQLILLTIIWAVRGQVRQTLPAWGGYLLWLLLLWLAAGQQPGDLPAYLANGYEIASGYTEAMASPFWDSSSAGLINLASVAFLVLALGVLGLLAAYILLHYRQTPLLLFALLASPMVFLAFKEGFVRFDPPHMALFYSQILLLTMVFFGIAAEQGVGLAARQNRLLLPVLAVSCCLMTVARFEWFEGLPVLVSEHTRQQTLADQKTRLVGETRLAAAHRHALQTSASADVIPVNIALLYALGATWNPRPVMQSYSVYTSALSQLNGRHYSGPHAPDLVLMSYYTIDGRYPLYDEPNTLTALLTHYRVKASEAGSYVLLQRRNVPEPAKPGLRTRQLQHLGQPFPIRAVAGRNTFLSARVELTILGRLVALLYKIPPLTISIHTTEGIQVHRAIRRTLAEGVLVSAYCKGVDELAAVMERRMPANITGVGLSGNSWFYQSPIPVTLWII